jgi:hypothetical protein
VSCSQEKSTDKMEPISKELTGITGSFVVLGVSYLQAVGVLRDVLAQAMGVLFPVFTVALVLSLGDRRLLTQELGRQALSLWFPCFSTWYRASASVGNFL